jgi:hypothetical protein
MKRSTQILGTLLTLTVISLSVVFMVAGMAYGQPAIPPAQPPGCDESAVKLQNPIVYTSSPRDLQPLPPWDDRTLWQVPSDVMNIVKDFEESDLQIKYPGGVIETIYNCTASPVDCAAQEGRASPDGKKIVYSVTFGKLWQHNSDKSWHLGAPISARLYLYDIATKKSTEIPNQPAPVVNRMPDWIDNNRIVYSSNAANVYGVRDQWNCHQVRGGECISQAYGYGHEAKSMQIWRMNIDGTAQVNLTPHEIMAIRPTVLRHPNNKGRIAYSTWQSAFDKGFYGGGPGASTIVNLWWIMTIDENGGAPASMAGAHHSGYINKEAQPGFQQIDQFMALRSVGEDPQGRIYFTNYYRANHFGLGTLYRMTPPVGDFQVEGCSTQDCYQKTVTPSSRKGTGQYIPTDLRAVTTFGVGSDNDQNIDKQGRAVGKIGFVAPMANGNVMATWGQGLCYNQPLAPNGFDGTKASIGGQPLCDRQIVEILVDRVTDPFDRSQMRVLVGSPLKNEWDAVEVAPRPATHVQPPLDATKGCYIEVADLRNAELYPVAPAHQWNMRAKLVGVQGNSVNPYKTVHRDRVKALAFYGAKLHSTSYPNATFKAAANYTGFESVWFIGKQDIQADGSVKAQIPCNQPFFMAAVDDGGRQITHDAFLQSLRPGETRTCFGCHDGHSIERRAEIGQEPQAAFARTLAAGTSPALLNGKVIEPWPAVAAAITKACGGCHAGFQNDSTLWSRVFADQEQLDFPWMTRMKNSNGGSALPRPYFSGLVARYPDWSMLYWVMAGKRTDGYTNAEFADDQDYPTGHPAVPVTAAEIATVVRYIQQGAPRP